MKLLSTAEAAAYLSFRTAAGIRALVYAGELAPDGRGYRGGYVFSTETLDRWFKTRQARHDERRRGHQADRSQPVRGAGEAAQLPNRQGRQPQGDGAGEQGRRAQGARPDPRRARLAAVRNQPNIRGTVDAIARIAELEDERARIAEALSGIVIADAETDRLVAQARTLRENANRVAALYRREQVERREEREALKKALGEALDGWEAQALLNDDKRECRRIAELRELSDPNVVGS